MSAGSDLIAWPSPRNPRSIASDHDVVVDRGQVGVVHLSLNLRIPLVLFVGREASAGVFDESRSSGNGSQGKGAESVHW